MKKRIAVLGGGIAGLSAAWELVRAGHSVAVYQAGWRLGGKGASGRNAEENQRIEEHGLHAFSGIYHHAFTVMRDAYARLERPEGAPLRTWREAFKPCQHFILHEQWRGRLVDWSIVCPTNAELPGGPDAGLSPLTYLQIGWDVCTMLRGGTPPNRIPVRDEDARTVGPLGRASIAVILALAPLVLPLLLPIWRLLLQQAWQRRIRARIEEDRVRMGWAAVHFSYALLLAWVTERVPSRGFSALDNEDFRALLRRYAIDDRVDGVSPTVDGPLTGFLYDAQFAYRDGDLSRPDFAAGTAMKTIFRMALCWKGSVIWKMQAGMGDVVFVPLYLALRQAGVQFHFFHAVTGLEAEAGRLLRVRIRRQVDLPAYQPLREVQGLLCWPSTPDWTQIPGGSAEMAGALEAGDRWGEDEQFTLDLGKEVDAVVLAISLGGLPALTTSLAAVSPRWQKMLSEVRTVQTQAVQIWFRTEEEGEEPEQGKIGVCFRTGGRLNTWATMDHLLPRENWPDSRRCWYFCGVHSPESAAGDLHGDIRTILDGPFSHLSAGMPLSDASFYHHRMHNLSDRFVQSVAGSTQHRLAPGDSGFAGLFLAGDWTKTGFDLGNAECATLSGRMAAQAILE